jgi:hypothetical protein
MEKNWEDCKNMMEDGKSLEEILNSNNFQFIADKEETEAPLQSKIYLKPKNPHLSEGKFLQFCFTRNDNFDEDIENVHKNKNETFDESVFDYKPKYVL